MKNVGCTTPYGSNLNQICTDEKLAKEAWKIFESEHYNTSCMYPCTHLSNFALSKSPLKRAENGYREVFINAREFIKTFEASCTYSGLDLFAAVGGYIGLFLGMSILNISDVISMGMKKLAFY